MRSDSDDIVNSLSEVEVLAKEFREFTYMVSHDLNAPVRGIVEFSKLLKAEHPDALNEESKLYLSLIVENGVKLQNMIAALLEYSRLNTMAKTLSKVNCNTVLDHCRIILKEKIDTSRGTLDVATLPTISIDAEQCMQLFLVLLDNAFKFYAHGSVPHVHVSAQRQDNKWVFSVQDKGIGIEQNFHQTIFAPFQRLHTDQEYPGVGIGLALAKKIVTRHGGKLWVESTPATGTAFKFFVAA